MAIDQVKTINELERLPQLLGNYAAAISTGAATGSATIDQIREYVRQTLDNDFFQTGMMIPYGGDNAPQGWLKCDGSAISRETYADLFAVIGTKYGSGDGSTTFNIPNLTSPVFSGTLPVVGNGSPVNFIIERTGDNAKALRTWWSDPGHNGDLFMYRTSSSNVNKLPQGVNGENSFNNTTNLVGLSEDKNFSGMIARAETTNINMIIKY